ncbi:MAG: HAMP domain-containing sensor histidine kinase [Bdellovibrionota bacterium]
MEGIFLKKNKVKSAFNFIFAAIVIALGVSTIYQVFTPIDLRETVGTQIPYTISGYLFWLAFVPPVLGIVASFISKAHDRPKIWTVFYLALFYFQINDTLVFVEAIKGIYFVRFYPLLVSIFLGLEVFERYRRENENKKIDAAKMQVAWDTANQVVHDIQSPLSAYRIALDIIKDELPEERRVLFRDIYSRLSGITASLSKQMKTSKGSVEIPEQRSVQPLSSLLDSLVAEKRLEFQGKLDVNILFDMTSESYGVFSAVTPSDFKRVVSNIINNGMEATDSGSVTITLSKSEGYAIISIKDSGKGMSKDELKKLGLRGVSWKENGSGLGFSFAKKCVEQWGGMIDVESEVGQGTTVLVKLPVANSPDWFIDKVRISKDTTVVVLDDDPSIHSSWDNKLKAFGKSISIKHFSEPASLKDWLADRTPKNAIYFIDYEFLNSTDNGLNFIRENKLESKSVLVTSRADEETIKAACSTCCVKLLPKAMVSSIPIVTSEQIKPDAVLVEDDEMVISTWLHSAKRYNRDLRAFSNREDLLAQVDRFDSETAFYLDSRLKEDRGEEVAKILYLKGFKKLYIASGNSDLAPDVNLFVEGIAGKSPPWIPSNP